MARLTEEQKVFVVQLLGGLKTPTQVGKLLKEEFGLDEIPTTSQLARYKPTRIGGEPLSDDLKTIFYEARERAEKEIDSIGIVHLSWRAEQYTDLYEMALKSKNVIGALAILKQAAQDKGGMFTQRVNGATPAQVDAYADYLTGRFLEQVNKHVKAPEQKRDLVAGIKTELAKLRTGRDDSTPDGSGTASEDGDQAGEERTL